jgi:hypothetical protein
MMFVLCLCIIVSDCVLIYAVDSRCVLCAAMYVYNAYVYLSGTVLAATSQMWSITTCIATNYYNEFHVDGVKMGYLASRQQQPYGLGLGTGGCTMSAQLLTWGRS